VSTDRVDGFRVSHTCPSLASSLFHDKHSTRRRVCEVAAVACGRSDRHGNVIDAAIVFFFPLLTLTIFCSTSGPFIVRRSHRPWSGVSRFQFQESQVQRPWSSRSIRHPVSTIFVCYRLGIHSNVSLKETEIIVVVN